MKIIIGLGNPGKKYEKTRHNIGFMFLDYLKESYKFDINKEKFNSLIGEKNINGEKYFFVKPLTYMNLSGSSVNEIINYYNVDLKDIIVIYDDIDIDFGNIRFREKGSAGTHNGMKHIIQVVKSNEFKRIKIGIGNLKHQNQDLADFVLENFRKEEIEELNNIFKQVEEKLFLEMK